MTVPFARIGTRGSPLALWQAEAVRTRLAAAAGVEPQAIAIVTFRTTGDKIQDRPLSEAGGKGLFTREIDEALLAGTIDLAVHSAKDLPTLLPAGTVLVACLPRADVRDAFISSNGRRLDDLPAGALVGTASLRRAALLLRRRPDLRIASLRGNVGTRLRRIEAGAFDATLLAAAGLVRLGLEAHAAEFLKVDEFPPALGQGTIAIAARQEHGVFAAPLAGLDHMETSRSLACERAFLAELEGSCRMPIAGLAEIGGGMVQLCGLVLSPDGTFEEAETASGPADDAARVGAEAGRKLHGRLPAGFLASIA